MVNLLEKVEIDGTTVTFNDNVLKSKLLFTDKEATVPSNSIEQFLFRELDNSNSIMACTGILVGGTWYGDRPDDGVYTNPFTSQVITRGNPPPEKVAFLMKETWQGNQIQLVRWSVNQPTLIVRKMGGVSGSDTEYQPTQVIDTTLNGQPAKHYVYDLGSASVRFQQQEEMDITLDGVEYSTNSLPRLAYEDSLGTFGVEGLSVDDVKNELASLNDS